MLLEGVKVVELGTYIAAPGAGALLAEWGAEVVKVEPPSGCPLRGFTGAACPEGVLVDPVFTVDNKNKKTAAVDISREEGREAVRRLSDGADVFLTNVRPSSLEKNRLDYATLRERNPRLVYASLSGYGLTGEGRDRAGFDITSFFARTGVAWASTPKGEGPLPPRTALGDHVTSLATASGVLAALYAREKTGLGRLVETALQRTGIYSIGSDMGMQLTLGRAPAVRRRGGLARNPLTSYFRTKDDRWVVIIPRLGSGTGKDWKGICRALGVEDAADDERFATIVTRQENSAALMDVLEPAFGDLTLLELGRRLDEEDLIWSEALTLDEAVQDSQARETGVYTSVLQKDGTTHEGTLGPVRFWDEPGVETRTPTPTAPGALGGDNEEVFLGAGFSEEEVSALRESGILVELWGFGGVIGLAWGCGVS